MISNSGLAGEMNFWRLCHMEHTLMPWEKVGPQFKKSYKRAGMLVDLDRCIGCHSCSVSCKTENDVPLGNFRMRVRYLEQPDQSVISFAPPQARKHRQPRARVRSFLIPNFSVAPGGQSSAEVSVGESTSMTPCPSTQRPSSADRIGMTMSVR